MARVVGVHGIGQQLRGPAVLAAAWAPALRDGVQLAAGTSIADDDVAVAFYGDLFRPAGKDAARGLQLTEDDVAGPERELLEAWASGVETEPRTLTDAEKSRTPRTVQRALKALVKSRLFAGIAEHLVIADLKQVTTYLHDAQKRSEIRARVLAAIGPDTRVLVGHSLGSVVAYEVLAANPSLPVRALVTIGSPLGIRNLVFDQLVPPPRSGHGAWPGAIAAWTNVADSYDVVALEKHLAPMFDARVVDELVDNGARAHDASPYLTARETGRAIAAGLTL
jgi:hypothetical protein